MQIQPFVPVLAWTCLIAVPQIAFAAPTLAQRESAARVVADRDPLCTAITPFYWEIGDREGARAAVGQGDGTVTGSTSMLVASASKWIFGAYLVSCPQARHTPTPKGESWHYSLGHWVEDDPQVDDGAFSSPGAFGFYPWIDGSRTWYGIVARQSDITLTNLQPYQDSLRCGRAIRKAWMSADSP